MNFALRGDRRELLERARPDAPPMKIVGDRERDLGHAHLTQSIPAGYRHHPSAKAADQGKPIDTGRLRLGAGDRVRTAVAVEAKDRLSSERWS